MTAKKRPTWAAFVDAVDLSEKAAEVAYSVASAAASVADEVLDGDELDDGDALFAADIARRMWALEQNAGELAKRVRAGRKAHLRKPAGKDRS